MVNTNDPEEMRKIYLEVYGYSPVNDKTRRFDVAFCMNNCRKYGREALDTFRKDQNLEKYNSEIADCLKLCIDPCRMQPFAVVYNYRHGQNFRCEDMIVEAENINDLIKKIVKELASR
ncbi:hypothetical protein HYY69_08590 [Candidatus Woesearchaeota archaeon]|nr:hypothetical protein [Candidatus Woesearchaeota archaeon]